MTAPSPGTKPPESCDRRLQIWVRQVDARVHDAHDDIGPKVSKRLVSHVGMNVGDDLIEQ